MINLKRDRRGERELLGQLPKDLRGRDDGALFGGERGERLRELRVAVVLAGVRVGEELPGGGEFGGKLGAIAAVGAPGLDGGNADDERQASGGKF